MAVVIDLSAALASTFSHDASIRQQAEQHLDQLKETNFPGYLASITNELGNEDRADDIRQAAALQLKNSVDAKDAVRRQDLMAKWQGTDAALKQHIRDVLLRCLHSPKGDVRKTTALVIAKIANIDMQSKAWPALIPTLLNNMAAQPPASVGTRQATLTTFGYICEEVDESLLSPENVNMILTAVVAGMGQSEQDDVRLAAIKALTNAIHLARGNFEVETERTYLMTVVCQCTLASNQPMRVAAFQCLQQIADNYYPKLQSYMTELYQLSTKAIKDDEDEVATQAIEFWSTVAEYELELVEDGKEDQCKNFIASAAEYLLPLMLDCLAKQDEDSLEDEGTWNRAMAAGFFLKLLARICKDRLVPQVLPFVTGNISSPDWHYREAATFAFGSIMEGPAPAALDQFVRAGLPFLMNALKDQHRVVRETTAWALGQVFEHLHGNEAEGQPPIVAKESIPPLLSALVASLKDEPRVVYYVCDALRFLALGFQSSEGETTPLSPYLKDLVQNLYETAERFRSAPCENSGKAQVAAYEAINDLVRSSARDTLEFVGTLLQVVLGAINTNLETQITSHQAAEKMATLQGQLCGMLQVCMERLCRSDDARAALVPLRDKIMETLLQVMARTQSGAGVHEEAMLAVGTFTVAVGSDFEKYLQNFMPFVRAGLQDHMQWQVCLSTVGVLGDVCRAVGVALWPYCDELVSIILSNLGSPNVHRNIKPELLTVLGDMALAIEGNFAKYLDAVVTILRQAMAMSIQMVSSQDYDTYDYNNLLRRGIIDAFSGIVQGLGDDITKGTGSGSASRDRLTAELPAVYQFVASIGADKTAGDAYDEDVARAATALLGDLCSVLPVRIVLFSTGVVS
ncbi:hypothetical protein VOLCADRAFT_82561 [Volvox carteri f. nagariensis]|uniref:Importin N-terminal domain-containing protein n=1 Tax=Volvox carteri f. nagariensis TaxID=3068 RepID=D8U5N2_VOLCA|nr:uncharacterized protein VOLCADRAFT_82561 [Volvox carteri f. nagariensis]EFJ44948.1 hypothetical protein VOLCADRAFT_82561 [Volvox carteri f. nagariensis]|eukprot:XP_002953919.1 hypothetical protein VOLCADRAFT_82561 [Volvox carteri f. nagariensis]